jgi:hypothetical protein
VDIHFAHKKFEKYNCLIEIDRLSNEGQRVRLRERVDPANKAKH